MQFFEPKYIYSFHGYGNTQFKKAKAVILPVPYEGTVFYRHGTSWGPKAIIDASCNMETYDIELKKDINEVGIYTFDEVKPEASSPEKMVNELEKIFDKIIKFKKFPVMLGGEHSITTGPVRAFRKKYKDLTVLQLDAHADLRDEWEGTKFSHACVMRRCREITNVVQVGIRSMSEAEMQYVEKNKINTIFYSPELNAQKVLKHLTKNVYLTVDLDAFNPALMPAVGTPEPGGIIWYPFLEFLREIFKKVKIVGADVVELSPISGNIAPDFMAAVIVNKILGYKFYNN